MAFPFNTPLPQKAHRYGISLYYTLTTDSSYVWYFPLFHPHHRYLIHCMYLLRLPAVAAYILALSIDNYRLNIKVTFSPPKATVNVKVAFLPSLRQGIHMVFPRAKWNIKVKCWPSQRPNSNSDLPQGNDKVQVHTLALLMPMSNSGLVKSPFHIPAFQKAVVNVKDPFWPYYHGQGQGHTRSFPMMKTKVSFV